MNEFRRENVVEMLWDLKARCLVPRVSATAPFALPPTRYARSIPPTLVLLAGSISKSTLSTLLFASDGNGFFPLLPPHCFLALFSYKLNRQSL